MWTNTRFTRMQRAQLLAIVVGVAAGMAAVVLKNMVHYIAFALKSASDLLSYNYLYFLYPVVGIFLATLFMRYIVKRPSGHGVPSVLYSISQRKGFMERHLMFSSMITSSLTVGFGGSVGLEGPIVGTGAAIGSNIARAFRMNYKEVTLMIGCACSGAVASIFNAPIAGIIFSLEILMLDLTMSSLIPILISSVTAILTSYLFIGNDVLYPFIVKSSFVVADLPFYLGLGVFCALASGFFSFVYFRMTAFYARFGRIKSLFVGGGVLGICIFLFPQFYGEGYFEVNSCLAEDLGYLFNNSIFTSYAGDAWVTMLLLAALTFLKVFATSATFGAGGVGGVFAPSLFVGAHGGMLFALLVNAAGLGQVSPANFALVGMAGLMSGVLYAPLFSIFLIAEVSGGYALLLPLMITSTVSYMIVKRFAPNSIYTRQLAEQRILITHDKDKAALTLMKIDSLIETDFTVIRSGMSLGDLFTAVTTSKRNVFPVIDGEKFKGIVFVNDIRHLLLRKELYDIVSVSDIMFRPAPVIRPTETTEEVVRKFRGSPHYNLPVVDGDRYLGFISRANTFSAYQRQMSDISEE